MMLRSAASPGSWGWSTGRHIRWFLVPSCRPVGPRNKNAAPETGAAFFVCDSGKEKARGLAARALRGVLETVRSEERTGGKEVVGELVARWSTYLEKNKKNKKT